MKGVRRGQNEAPKGSTYRPSVVHELGAVLLRLVQQALVLAVGRQEHERLDHVAPVSLQTRGLNVG